MLGDKAASIEAAFLLAVPAYSHEETLQTKSKTYLPQRHRGTEDTEEKLIPLLAAPQACLTIFNGFLCVLCASVVKYL